MHACSKQETFLCLLDSSCHLRSSSFSNHCKPHVFESMSPYRQKGCTVFFIDSGTLNAMQVMLSKIPVKKPTDLCKQDTSAGPFEASVRKAPGSWSSWKDLLVDRVTLPAGQIGAVFFSTWKDLATCWSILYHFPCAAFLWSVEALDMSASAVRSVQVTWTLWLSKEITNGGYMEITQCPSSYIVAGLCGLLRSSV